MEMQVTVSASGANKVGKTIFDADATHEGLKGLYPKPSPRKGEVTRTARVRLAANDGVITSDEAVLLLN